MAISNNYVDAIYRFIIETHNEEGCADEDGLVNKGHCRWDCKNIDNFVVHLENIYLNDNINNYSNNKE